MYVFQNYEPPLGAEKSCKIVQNPLLLLNTVYKKGDIP